MLNNIGFIFFTFLSFFLFTSIQLILHLVQITLPAPAFLALGDRQSYQCTSWHIRLPIHALARFPSSTAVAFIYRTISHFAPPVYELLTNFYEVQRFPRKLRFCENTKIRQNSCNITLILCCIMISAL